MQRFCLESPTTFRHFCDWVDFIQQVRALVFSCFYCWPGIRNKMEMQPHVAVAWICGTCTAARCCSQINPPSRSCAASFCTQSGVGLTVRWLLLWGFMRCSACVALLTRTWLKGRCCGAPQRAYQGTRWRPNPNFTLSDQRFSPS